MGRGSTPCNAGLSGEHRGLNETKAHLGFLAVFWSCAKHSPAVQTPAPQTPATVSSIASWSTGVSPRAPISDVPTIALAVRDSCPFEALTC
jgi:hypothetical protein